MKKYVAFLLAVVLMFSLSSCGLGSRVRIDKDDEARLIFNDIDVVLTDEEKEMVFEIFDGSIERLTLGASSCGFDENVAIQFGSYRFLIANDTCGTAMVGTRAIVIDDEDIEYIHKLFEKYGGHFPCI